MVLSEEDADLLCSEDAAVEKKGEVWRRFWNEELEKVTEDTLRIAKERLSTMFHFGITEAFGQSIEMFAFKMGVAIVGEELRRERAPDTQREKRESRYAIEDIELIQYENKYDIELFNYAKQLFYERYGEFLESKAKGGTVPVVRTRLTQTMLESRFETAGGWRGFRQSKQGMRTFGFLWEVSNRCCNDSIVLDISAGKCLYKSFFEHAQYVAFDSPVDNPNVGNSRMDLHGDAHQLPIREESIDLCVNLAGLERYKNPYALFQEIARILKPGGWLFLHVSFATAEHGTPNDFFRYTRYALAEFCTQNGLRVAFILPTNGLFQTTLNLLEYSLSTLDESMRNPLTALVNQAIKPLFQKLDDVDGVAQEYPKSCRMLQIPSAYCLGALKPGRHTVSDLSITKRDLLEKITACPICQGELEWRSEEILCKACNKVYPIRSGIPYFILD